MRVVQSGWYSLSLSGNANDDSAFLMVDRRVIIPFLVTPGGGFTVDVFLWGGKYTEIGIRYDLNLFVNSYLS